jgi:hypothetical protein
MGPLRPDMLRRTFGILVASCQFWNGYPVGMALKNPQWNHGLITILITYLKVFSGHIIPSSDVSSGGPRN